MTVDQARMLLWKYATADPNDATGEFLMALNQAVERIYSEGIWTGLKTEVDLKPFVSLDEATLGILTLPYQYDVLLAIQIDDHPYTLIDEAVEYSPSGYGERAGGRGGNIVIDNGFVLVEDRLCHQYKLTSAVNPSTTLRGLVKRRFVYLEDGCDLVFPTNLGALKNALLAVNFEDQSDPERAKIYWEECYRILNSQSSLNRTGSAFPVAARMLGLGAAPSVASMY